MLFRNVRTFMKNAGGTTDDIVHMRVMVKEMKYRDSIDKEWVRMFPSDNDRPARRADIVEVPVYQRVVPSRNFRRALVCLYDHRNVVRSVPVALCRLTPEG